MVAADEFETLVGVGAVVTLCELANEAIACVSCAVWADVLAVLKILENS